jgi:putative ABC transport system substrate-binding protein
MRRRDFIGLLGGAAVWPLAARAQQPDVPVIGYLHFGSPDTSAPFTAAFRKGLSEMGYVEGRNVAMEYRWAEGDNARLPELAADLVRRRVSVIATPFFSGAILAAKAATTTIPIVFSTGADPVQLGVVANFKRPGGNATGVSYMSVELVAKRVGLLHELLPAATRYAVLVNPRSPNAEALIRNGQAAAAAIRRSMDVLSATTNRDIDMAFARLVQMQADVLLVSPDTLFSTRRVQLATLAARYALPAIYPFREHAEAGGLMSYGASIPGEYRDVGIYVGRILKGESPADLPVIQPTKFEFVINLQTARLLGIEIPPTLRAQADEVIE